MPELSRAAFVDRDGVINEERGYVHRAEDFVLLPGVVEGLRSLQDAGFVLIVVTNQAGIARGFYSESSFFALTRHMTAALAGHGVRLASTYHCPHHPDAGVGVLRTRCECRKPKPGMILRAAADHGIALSRSVLIGDRITDVQAGRAAGVGMNVLISTAPRGGDAGFADVVCPSLVTAARWVLGREIHDPSSSASSAETRSAVDLGRRPI